MYKTKYPAAITASKTTFEELVPKTQRTIDHLLSLQEDVKKLRESLKDAEAADKQGINEAIATTETVIRELDEGLVIKIQKNADTIAKVSKMQEGRKNKLAAKSAAPPPATPPPATPPPATPPPATPPPAQQQAAPATPPAAKVVNIEGNKAAKTKDEKDDDDDNKPKKKRNLFWQILGAAAAFGLAGYGIHASINHKFPFNKK